MTLMSEAALTDHYRLINYHRIGYGQSDRASGPMSVAETLPIALAILAVAVALWLTIPAAAVSPAEQATPQRVVAAADTSWIEPMKQVHARFTGTPGTLA